MLKKIDPVAWSVLMLAVIGAKLFLLPDTKLMAAIAVGVAGLCGVGAVISMNRMMQRAEELASESDTPEK